MIKKIFLTSLLACAMFGASDREVADYITSLIKKNPQLTPKSVKVFDREKLAKYDNWEALKVLVEYSVNDKQRGRLDIKMADMYFTKNNLITNELADTKADKNLKDILKPKLTASYYNDEHFVAGNKNSKNKIVVFSDPLCPVCKDNVPDILNTVIKNPTKAAIWHYSYPLSVIHPASPTIVKAELVLVKKMSLKDILLKFYSLDINPEEKDEGKILSEIEKQLKLKVTKEEINSKEIQTKYDNELQNAYTMLVRGTPSVYMDGELDSSRSKISALIKELGK
jgi:protein-disulfide isomerase